MYTHKPLTKYFSRTLQLAADRHISKRFAIHFGRRRGQAVILMVVAMGLFMAGAIGLAIDGGQIYAQYQMAQAAADAAASAGIMSIMKGTNTTATYTFATGTPPLASYVCTTTDGRTPCVYARYNGFGATSSDTVTLSYPSTVSGVTLSSVNVPALKVTVQRVLNNGLIRMVGGPATTTIKATATAGLTGTASPYCVYALNASGSYALAANANAMGSPGSGSSVDISISGCAMIADSNSPSAFLSLAASTTVTATAIDLVGSDSASSSGTVTPVPVAGVAVVADPFAALPALTPGSCLYAMNYSPPNGTTLVPGTYCGGINVTAGNTVTFSAGNYIINGGGVSFLAGGTSTGTGVMFYLTGTNMSYGSVTANATANVTLTAPTSGKYRGILFFQDRSITSPMNATFATTGTLALTGSLYFPTTDVFFQGGAGTTSYITAIVANEIYFTNSTYITNDSTGAITGLSSGTSGGLMQ